MSQGFDPFDPEDWGDKPGCSAFETALEMRERGALAPAAVPVLEAHLGACDACRDHAARLGRVTASLVAAAPSLDARRLRVKLDSALKASQRTPWVMAGVGVALGVVSAALLWLFGVPIVHQKWLLLFIPLVVVAGGLGAHVRVLRLRRLLAEPDTVRAYRRWVEWNVKGARRVPWYLAPSALLMTIQMSGNVQRYAAGEARAGAYVLLEIVSIVAFFVAFITSRRRARRLKVELAEMH